MNGLTEEEMKQMSVELELKSRHEREKESSNKELQIQSIEYQKKLQRLDKKYEERLRFNEVNKDLEVEMVEKEFSREKKSALREFEDQKVYLKEQLIVELEEKQKLVEAEFHNTELTGDSMEMKPITTRKLRRRANESSGTGTYRTGQKRRKPMQLSSVTYLLEDSEVIDDLKIINRNKDFSMNKTHSQSSSTGSSGGLNPKVGKNFLH